MPANRNQSSSPFITQRELATRWLCSLKTLEVMRRAGTGPAFFRRTRLGPPLYPIAEVEKYEREHMVRSTSQEDAA